MTVSSGCGTEDRWPTPNTASLTALWSSTRTAGSACRLDVAAADDVAAEAGVRLISPDRPGVGTSRIRSPIARWRAGRHDVEELVDGIGVDRFAGPWGGGWAVEYAAAVGYFLRHRVTRVAIIAGAPPLTETGVFDQLPTMDRHLTRISQRAPWLARADGTAIMGLASRAAPVLYGRHGRSRAGDGRQHRSSAGKASALSHGCRREGMRQPAGVVEEYPGMDATSGALRRKTSTFPSTSGDGTQDQLLDPELAATARVTNPQRRVESSRRRTLRRAYCTTGRSSIYR